MRRQNHPRAMFRSVVNRGDGGANACVVVNFSVFDGNVEVDANENAFALKLNISNRKLLHKQFRVIAWSCFSVAAKRTTKTHKQRLRAEDSTAPSLQCT